MNKIIGIISLFILIIGVSIVWAEDKSEEHKITRIYITLEERKEIEPDKLLLKVEITAKKQREGEVINLLGAIDKEIRALKLDYKGGSYSVNKNCFLEKNKWRCIGYLGNLIYSFYLKEPREQNQVLEILEAFKEKEGGSLEYHVSDPTWIISEKLYKEKERELKLEILSTAVEFGKQAGERLGRRCVISKIDYEIRGFYFPLPYRPILKSSGLEMEKAGPSIEAPEPKKDEKAIHIKAQVSYVCLEKN